MSRILVIRWTERAIRGYEDLIPISVFDDSQEFPRGIEHRVRGPRMGEHRAKCKLSVKGRSVYLDYRPFAEFNRARGMDIGVLRVTFADRTRGTVRNISWKGEHVTHFQPAEAHARYDSVAPGQLQELYEGTVRRLAHRSVMRNRKARQDCIDAHGSACAVCGFDFGQAYGPKADGFVHVHHLRPLARRRGQYKVDPVGDLRPICANCHAVIHLHDPEYTLEEVRKMLTEHGGKPPNKALQQTAPRPEPLRERSRR